MRLTSVVRCNNKAKLVKWLHRQTVCPGVDSFLSNSHPSEDHWPDILFPVLKYTKLDSYQNKQNRWTEKTKKINENRIGATVIKKTKQQEQ